MMMQGLDALAAASDAATQAASNEQWRQQNNSSNCGGVSQQHTHLMNMQSGQQQLTSVTSTAHAPPAAPLTVVIQPESTTSAYSPAKQQWVQAINMFGGHNPAATSAAAAMMQAAFAQTAVIQASPGDAFNAMQHLAYYQYIHSQAAAQIAHMGNVAPGPAIYTDQNAAAFAFAGQHASAQQQQQQQQQRNQQQG
jgi:hypothetical protein